MAGLDQRRDQLFDESRKSICLKIRDGFREGMLTMRRLTYEFPFTPHRISENFIDVKSLCISQLHTGSLNDEKILFFIDGTRRCGTPYASKLFTYFSIFTVSPGSSLTFPLSYT
jgi:hypothetical protein